MIRNLILIVSAVLVLGLPAAGSPGIVEELEQEGWDVQVERVVQARAQIEDGLVSTVDYDEMTRLTAAAETGCTFTVTCNTDGTVDVTMEGCSPKQFGKILTAAADICGT